MVFTIEVESIIDSQYERAIALLNSLIEQGRIDGGYNYILDETNFDIRDYYNNPNLEDLERGLNAILRAHIIKTDLLKRGVDADWIESVGGEEDIEALESQGGDLTDSDEHYSRRLYFTVERAQHEMMDTMDDSGPE